VSADAAFTVIEVNSPDTSIIVTVAESAQKEEQEKKPSLENIELIVCDMADDSDGGRCRVQDT